jgi:hypothetical protein
VSTLNLWYIGISLLSWTTFVIAPSFLAYIVIRKIGVPFNRSLSAWRACWALIKGSFVCYLLHGASAYRGLVAYVRYLFGGQLIKKKTAMAHRIDG